MSEVSFQAVPVPDRFVLRVMSCITEWAAEEAPDHSSLPDEAAVWPAHQLKALSRDLTRRTPQIMTKMLDFLAATPGTFHRSDVIGRNIDEPAESVSAALRKLNGYFESRFGRTDRPFTQAGNAYAVTAAQAKAWTEMRRSTD
jgi:hypothetical protein